MQFISLLCYSAIELTHQTISSLEGAVFAFPDQYWVCSCVVYVYYGMYDISWWILLELLSWYHTIHVKYQVDKIYVYPTFKWVALKTNGIEFSRLPGQDASSWYMIICSKSSLWIHAQTHWFINSLWPNDAIWRHSSVSTLAQVLACCLMAPSHYLNQCWLIFSKVLWHLTDGIIIRRS